MGVFRLEKAHGDLIRVYKYLRRKIKNTKTDSSQWFSVTDNGQNQKTQTKQNKKFN